MNTCHCGAPAPWLLRAVPNGAEYATHAWAACDEHIAEAARRLTAAVPMEGKTLQLRAEPTEPEPMPESVRLPSSHEGCTHD